MRKAKKPKHNCEPRAISRLTPYRRIERQFKRGLAVSRTMINTSLLPRQQTVLRGTRTLGPANWREAPCSVDL
jgi:hypothetical protein